MKNRFDRIARSMIAGRRDPTMHSPPPHESLADLRKALRQKRRYLLGTYVSLVDLIGAHTGINPDLVESLSEYLTRKTELLWNVNLPDCPAFCMQFFTLSIYAIASGRVGNESIDDIIQLAECLVRDRNTFVTVMEPLIPHNQLQSLYDFADDYEDQYYSSTFEDAVMGALAILTGALQDPVAATEEEIK